MRKLFMPGALLLLLLMGMLSGGITAAQDETPTPTLDEIPTETPTETPTEFPTFTETPTEFPTFTETPTETPTEFPTFTETPVDFTPTPTFTETPTLFDPTLTPTATFAPMGLTRIFFFHGLPQGPVDVYANGLQIGAGVPTSSIVGPFSLLDGTTTGIAVLPAGTFGSPLLYGALAFEPGSTVLIVASQAADGTPAFSTFRLDTAAGQSQVIVVNASDAPTVDVAANGQQASVGSGGAEQVAVAPGTEAGLAGGQGAVEALEAGVVYVYVAIGSVTDGTYQVVTQRINLNALNR